MESYPVDIDPDQVVRWLMAERGTGSGFRVLARRSTEARDIPLRSEFGLGDGEREDLSEVATIVTLEIAPPHASDGWLLTVVVEDEAGPRMQDDEEEVDPDQEMDLDAFYNEFTRLGRGSANVIVEVAGPEARARVTRLLNKIERNSHSRRGAGKPAAP